MKKIREFAQDEPQADDITMMVIKYNGGRKAKVSSMIMLTVAAAFVFNGVVLTVEAGFYTD